MYKEIGKNKTRTALLLGFFLIFVIGLGWLFSYIFNNQWILALAVAIAIIQALVSYYYSDRVTLMVSGAQEASRKDFLDLHRVVENLAITTGLSKPKIYVIPDPAPNAFATGRDPAHAVVCVTTGLLDKLNKNELEGVIGHELSHIGNYDIRLMTIVVILVGVITLISNFTLRWLWFGGGRRSSNNSEGGQLQLILLLVGIILAILAPLGAMLIQLAISRRREFLADADSALLTRYPKGLADALELIAKDPHQLRTANQATAHLFITNPFKGKASWFANLFSTHPPIAERVKILRNMIK